MINLFTWCVILACGFKILISLLLGLFASITTVLSFFPASTVDTKDSLWTLLMSILLGVLNFVIIYGALRFRTLMLRPRNPEKDCTEQESAQPEDVDNYEPQLLTMKGIS